MKDVRTNEGRITLRKEGKKKKNPVNPQNRINEVSWLFFSTMLCYSLKGLADPQIWSALLRFTHHTNLVKATETPYEPKSY